MKLLILLLFLTSSMNFCMEAPLTKEAATVDEEQSIKDFAQEQIKQYKKELAKQPQMALFNISESISVKAVADYYSCKALSHYITQKRTPILSQEVQEQFYTQNLLWLTYAIAHDKEYAQVLHAWSDESPDLPEEYITFLNENCFETAKKFLPGELPKACCAACTIL